MLHGLPVAERDADSAPFWAGCDEGVLRLPTCRGCSTPRWPPAAVCPRCGDSATDWVESSGSGSVYSWVVVHVAFDEALRDQLPYAVGLIELDEGVRIVSTIEEVDFARIRAGMPVVVRFDEQPGKGRIPSFVPDSSDAVA
jgi:uncharacterized OB-fold protein